MLRMFSINLGGGGGSGPPGPGTALAGHANSLAIPDATQTIHVSFVSLLTTGYAMIAQVMNYTDPNPIMLQVIAVVKNDDGFDVTFNAPTDSANYVLEWIVVSNA